MLPWAVLRWRSGSCRSPAGDGPQRLLERGKVSSHLPRSIDVTFLVRVGNIGFTSVFNLDLKTDTVPNPLQQDAFVRHWCQLRSWEVVHDALQ